MVGSWKSVPLGENQGVGGLRSFWRLEGDSFSFFFLFFYLFQLLEAMPVFLGSRPLPSPPRPAVIPILK